MAQVGLIGRASVTYKDGQKTQDRGWDFLHTISGTYLAYCFNIRQQYPENIFRTALEQHGDNVDTGWKLKNFVLDNDADDYMVSSETPDQTGTTVAVKSKYIIGADGGKSSVRHIAGIPFFGEKSAFQWVRIDAVIHTDMPQSRIGFGAIESATHGIVLWVTLYHERSRIGFALPKAPQDQYGESITEEIVKQEAAKAMAPLEIDFVSVDWWTLYSIGQRVADTFQHQDRIILAGDAAHTHSSRAVQGMNTGVHDAANLAWKLGGVLKGWYKPEVLKTYSPERRAVAQHLIKLDKTISTLISGPESYTGNVHDEDANSIFIDVINLSAQFTIGLGVAYEPDNFWNRAAGFASVRVGRRAPDVLVQKPGSRLPTRLYELTKNNDKFWVVVFAGEPLRTAGNLKALRAYLNSANSFTKRLTNAFDFLTIIAGTA